jgi:class 3 adenylate cyclase/tetratricopeptide (TPR) repeat protein
MICQKCGFENRESAKFCSECATKLEFACPQCGTINSSGSKFCDECAYDLRQQKESVKIDYAQPQSYIPKNLAEKILTARSTLEGERKLVTVIFADVVGFTALSEKLEPEEVHQIMEGCLRILMDEIHKYEGTINQFTGDGVMALFGAPLAHEDHAQRACYAALAIQKELIEYAEKIRKDYGREFRMRIGLNSGPVVVGSIGDDLHMDYTAIGDTINLASRMEGLAKPGKVLLSRNTHRLVKDYFDLKPMGRLEVKGKEEPQEAFDLVKAGGAATRLEASMARGLTRFVGRENSMATLMEAYEKVKSGTGQVVGMVGEAGVGKSRLLWEFRHRLPQDEFGYLEGHCIHFGGAMPYLPILDILRSYFEIREGEREIVLRKRVKEKILGLDEKLQGIIAPIQDLLSLKVEDEAYLKLEPKQRREKVFEALRDLFIRESQERPLVLVVEDLHWIDRTSEEFLDYLIGWLANVKVMLVLLYRPEYTHSWENKSYFNRIGLDQLTMKSSAELVRAILEGGETAPELSNLILNRAAGNPLFMEELTHSLLENGSIQRTGDQYVLSKKSSDLQVPDTIQGIIAARIDRLEENLKRIMQVASVIGREFAFRILQSISDMREDLKSELLNLQGLELIYEKSLFPELEYVFKHALTQEVAYNSLLVKRRSEIHKKIGEAIEALYPERQEEFYEVLAHHYSRSDNADKASHYLKLSGDKASQCYANWEAIRFYKGAIDIIDRQPETEDNKKQKMQLILSVCGPMVLTGYPDSYLEILKEGERLSRDMGDSKSLATIYGRIGNYYSRRQGNASLGMEYAEKCLREAEKVEAIDLIAPIAPDLCGVYHFQGHYLRVIDLAPKVLGLIEKQQRQKDFFGMTYSPYSGLSAYYGWALGALGRFSEGKAVLEKGLENAIQIKDKFGEGVVEFWHAAVAGHEGDGQATIEHAARSIRLLEETRAAVLVGVAWVLLGHGYGLIEDYETAKDHVEKGLKMQSEMSLPYGPEIAHSALAWIYYERSDISKAINHAQEAMELSRRLKARNNEALAHIYLGRSLGRGEPTQADAAEENIRQGIRIAEEIKFKPYTALGYFCLGELYAGAGQTEKAVDALKKAKGMFLEMGLDPRSYWVAKTQEALAKT